MMGKSADLNAPSNWRGIWRLCLGRHHYTICAYGVFYVDRSRDCPLPAPH